jgi:hypothetical protein
VAESVSIVLILAINAQYLSAGGAFENTHLPGVGVGD